MVVIEGKASKELFTDVIDMGLCTMCGGCIGSCPYLVFYNRKIVRLYSCALSEGQCYQCCPRTYTDMDEISQKIFGVSFTWEEMGIARDVFLARSSDADIREKGRVGGTVTTLLSMALAEGFVDAAINAQKSSDKIWHGFLARNRDELLQGASISDDLVIAVYNRIPEESNEKLIVVGLPCHVASLVKRKMHPPQNRMNIDNVKLVIGLFCRAVMPACKYCWDLTAEFADISVGEQAESKGWDTVIVRTKAGAEFVEIAKRKVALETRPIPLESLNRLKKQALDKQKRAISNIIAKTGDRENLLYLGLSKVMRNRVLSLEANSKLRS